MKTMTVSLIVVLLLAGGLLAQEPSELFRSAGQDLLGALNGDTEKFERGMRTLDSLLEKSPNDPAVMVLHGNGVFARSGQAFAKGDMQNATKLWQAALDEMAQAVKMAPNNIFVRARRGVLLISATRSSAMPDVMSKPLAQLAVEDFEKVLEIREKEQTLAQGSIHKRGELLTALADGWNHLGNADKARGYFERVTRDMKGTIYEQKAKAWLEDKPEAKKAEYFACTGCHVE
jgi:tetratricopeptide (TPR) repeat protein